MEFIYVIRPSRSAMLTEGPTEAEAAVLAQHAAYVSGLADRNVVEFAGRTQTTDESTFGIVVFRAEDEEAARSVAENDPAVLGDVMTASLFPFSIAFLAARYRDSRPD